MASRPTSDRCARRAAAGCGLSSADRARAAAIRFNYMSHPDDWTEVRACVRLTREIFAQPAFDRFRGEELSPGAAVQTDEQIDAFIAEKIETAYHPSCSCRMGASSDPTGGGRPGSARDRARGLEGRGFLDHADDHQRQPERADHHAGGETRRFDSRPAAAAYRGRAGVFGIELGSRSALRTSKPLQRREPMPARSSGWLELCWCSEDAAG